MFATLVYNHCNICNIPIYFCNVYMEHLQHTSDTSKTLETYSCNISFQRNICLLLGRLKARRRGARCRRVARSSGGDDGRRGGECRGGRMARWRGRMAGGGAGVRWKEVDGRPGAVESVAAAWTRWWCGEWRGTDDGLTGRYCWSERIRKWRVGPLERGRDP
jgi:hypothetical protein